MVTSVPGLVVWYVCELSNNLNKTLLIVHGSVKVYCGCRSVIYRMEKSGICLFLFVLQLFPVRNVDGRQIPDRRPVTRRAKILILGAGVAGIVAAKTLKENGINDFLILEAQDYIGGRFKQESFAGVKLEEGANWIHYASDKKNPLWDLKEKHNLRGIYTNYSDVIIR